MAKEVKRAAMVVRNVGFDRNIGGLIVATGEVINGDESVRVLTRKDDGSLVAPAAALDQFLADWPGYFEAVEQAPQGPQPPSAAAHVPAAEEGGGR